MFVCNFTIAVQFVEFNESPKTYLLSLSISEIKDYLLVSSATAVRGIPLNVSSQEDVTLPLAGLTGSFSGSAVEYDGFEESVFYNDRTRQLIYQSPINGTSESVQILNFIESFSTKQTTQLVNLLLLSLINVRVVQLFLTLLFYYISDQKILTGYRVGSVESMAYDWTSKILFWTSSSYRTVSAFKITDGSRRDIVKNLIYPRGIAVHPSAG